MNALKTHYIFAVAAHGAVAFLLLLARVPAANSAASASMPQLFFRLVPPPEGNSPLFMASTNPNALPPEGRDSLPDGELTAGGELDMPVDDTDGKISDAELADILAKDRDTLRAELEQMTQTALADPLSKKPIPMPPPDSGKRGGSTFGPEGAVRELDLKGFPQAVVDDIMNRYKLKVVTRHIKGGQRGQSFLSSASRGANDTYFGGGAVPEGVYEIFQLSRDSVALMSRLEEEALKKRGLEPLKSRVINIVFGIVKSGNDSYVLGVKSLEAEAVE